MFEYRGPESACFVGIEGAYVKVPPLTHWFLWTRSIESAANLLPRAVGTDIKDALDGPPRLIDWHDIATVSTDVPPYQTLWARLARTQPRLGSITLADAVIQFDDPVDGLIRPGVATSPVIRRIWLEAQEGGIHRVAEIVGNVAVADLDPAVMAAAIVAQF